MIYIILLKNLNKIVNEKMSTRENHAENAASGEGTARSGLPIRTLLGVSLASTTYDFPIKGAVFPLLCLCKNKNNC